MRKSAESARTTVRLSVPVDVQTHARLCGLAALRGVDRSQIAAAILKAGLRGVVVRDGTEAETESPLPS